MIQRVCKKCGVILWRAVVSLLLTACSSWPSLNHEGSPARGPTASSRPTSETKVPVRFIYFGDDTNSTHLTYNNVKNGIDLLSIILRKECGIDLKYELEKRSGMSFSKNIEFPLEESEQVTPDGKIPFIFDQYDLYQEFSFQQLVKKRNEIYIVKTSQLGFISNTGRPRKVCGYANPGIQFNPQVPARVKANLQNTILFNTDQKNCSQDFSFVIAHEIAHLLIQDNPDHMIQDDVQFFYNAPPDNLIATSGGHKLSRKYQCPAIQNTLSELLEIKNR